MNHWKRRVACASALVLMGAGACSDINVPDYNRAGIGDLENAPNRTLVNAASAGMLASARIDAGTRVRFTGIVGREGYYLDTNEPRYVNELVAGAIDPSSFAGNHDFLNVYGTIQQGYVLLRAIDKVPTNDFTTAEKEALKGFTLTIMASEFLVIAQMHQYGPVDVDQDPLAPPAPMATQAQLYDKAAALFDEAVPHLQAGGGTFPFTMPAGFTQFGFNKPSTTFLEFNRGLRARLDLLRLNYSAALTHLGQSFVSTADASRAGFNRGAYYTYGTGSGDRVNTIGSGTPEVADMKLLTDAQLKANGQRDQRFLIKVDSTGAVRTMNGVSSNLRFTHYRNNPFFGATGQGSPIPWIRNEELILMRAEARWFTGDKPGAMADLNFVRTNSGGLDPIAQPATDAAFVQALLYERRYSLLWEGGFRWLDLRRYNMLSILDNYPRAGDHSITYWPIPFTECLARGGAGSAPGC